MQLTVNQIQRQVNNYYIVISCHIILINITQIASMPTMGYFSDHSDIEESDVETNNIVNFDYDNLHLGWSPESSPKFHV